MLKKNKRIRLSFNLDFQLHIIGDGKALSETRKATLKMSLQ